jgi:hypothetical protein
VLSRPSIAIDNKGTSGCGLKNEKKDAGGAFLLANQNRHDGTGEARHQENSKRYDD